MKYIWLASILGLQIAVTSCNQDSRGMKKPRPTNGLADQQRADKVQTSRFACEKNSETLVRFNNTSQQLEYCAQGLWKPAPTVVPGIQSKRSSSTNAEIKKRVQNRRDRKVKSNRKFLRSRKKSDQPYICRPSAARKYKSFYCRRGQEKQ